MYLLHGNGAVHFFERLITPNVKILKKLKIYQGGIIEDNAVNANGFDGLMNDICKVD